MDKTRKLLRFTRRDPVIVHDMEWITGLPHVQTRERAPSAADRVKSAIFAVMQHVEVFENLLDIFFGFLEGLPGNILQRKSAQRQGHTAAYARAMHIDQLERSAAKVA